MHMVEKPENDEWPLLVHLTKDRKISFVDSKWLIIKVLAWKDAIISGMQWLVG